MDSSTSSTVMLPLLTADPDPSQPSSRWVPWCHAGSQGAAVFGEPLHHKCLLVSPQAIILAWERGEGENRERGMSRAVNRRGTR